MTARATIAILAKAPIPGLAKTRLIPAIGAHAAAVLQERLIERAVETAIAAAIGRVMLWAAPDIGHPAFVGLVPRFAVTLRRQPEGDLGTRMLAAMTAVNGPVLVIGTDCPAITGMHLREAAAVLRDGADGVAIPVEDGGYALIGLAPPIPELLTGVDWGTSGVMRETRRRAASLGLRLVEMAMSWDIDMPDDLDRMERDYPELVL